MSLSTKRNEPRISNLILAQIKKEKTSMDDELEADRQQRMITLQKEREKKEAERLRQLNAKATKMLNTKPTKLYDYNPITNYYRYNAGVNHDLNLDASNCLNDQFYKESFEKFNLKPARLSVIDCLKDGLLKDVKIPVILTKYMKEKLNLNKSKNPPVNSTVNKKQKRKRRGSHQSEAPIPNVGKRHKITTEQNTEATTQQKLSAASTICMDVNNDIKRDTVSIQEENGAVSLLENIEKYLKNQNTKVELLPEEKTFLNEQSDNLNKSSSHHVDASIIDEKVVKNTNSNWLTDLMNKKATPKKSTTQGLLPPEENKENSEDKEMCIDESFTNFVSTQQTNYERVMSEYCLSLFNMYNCYFAVTHRILLKDSETPTDKAKDPLSQIIPKSKTKQATLIFGGGSDMSFTFGSLDGHGNTNLKIITIKFLEVNSVYFFLRCDGGSNKKQLSYKKVITRTLVEESNFYYFY